MNPCVFPTKWYATIRIMQIMRRTSILELRTFFRVPLAAWGAVSIGSPMFRMRCGSAL